MTDREPSGESIGLPTYGPTNDPAARISGETWRVDFSQAKAERDAALAKVERIEGERDAYHKRFSDVLKEHDEFMNDMLEALDLEIDEGGEFILDQIVAAAGKARTERDALLARITDGGFCLFCDGFGPDGDEIVHREDCETRSLVRADRGASILTEIAELRAVIARLDEHPTPVMDDGGCWYCEGRLGHGPDGHQPDCPLVAVRMLAGIETGRGAAIIAAGTSMAEALGLVSANLSARIRGAVLVDALTPDESLRMARSALDEWRALGLAAGDGDGEG